MNTKTTTLSLAALLVLAGCSLHIGPTKDDSDSESGYSEMVVRTDYKTGLQYLESTQGGLTPRLNEDGTQMKATP